jgi:serine/threonine protein kinase
MAQVYKGYHQQLDRFVAIKVLRPELVEESNFLSRFQKEARSVAALHHPHIVQVFDFDVQDGIYYMVMELLEGNSLKTYQNSYRKRSQIIPINISIKLLVDVLSGLGYAHKVGLIHRDLKPANILLNNRGQAILTDFGIAHMIGAKQNTVSGALMGTVSYMAPEQGLKNHYDFRSDLYSIGVIAYELLTGQVPFEADTPVAVLLKHINENLIPTRELNSQIPREIEIIVSKALEKDPEERFQTAKEFSDNLLEAVKKCKVDIPDFINIPSGLIEKRIVDNQKAIYSGNDRQAIPDISFSQGDTDSSISSGFFSTPSPEKENIRLYKLFNVPKDLKADDFGNYSTKQISLLGVLIIIIANICLFWVGGIYGWNIFIYSWPMELTAASLLLSLLMVSKASPWLLIPNGILLGNSLLLASSTTIGRWTIWTYTWPMEVFIIAGSIILPIYLARQGQIGRWISHKIGIIMFIVSGLSLSTIFITSLIKVIF